METDSSGEDGQVNESFSVHDAASANWVVRKIVEARQYAARVKAWGEAELRRAQRQEQFFLMRYGRQLEDWARQRIDQQHDGRRSANLPAGAIGFRTQPRRLSIVDEKVLLAWCRAHLPAVIRVIETVPKSPLIEHFQATGECPEGVEILSRTERFCISAKNLDFLEGGQDVIAEKEGE